MSKASGSIDLKSLKTSHDDASTKATNFIIADENGIMVADLSSNMGETPLTATGRNVFIDADSVDIRDGQTSLASFGETVRIGLEADSAIELSNDSIIGRGADGKEFFEFGASQATMDTSYGVEICDKKRVALMPTSEASSTIKRTIPSVPSGTELNIRYGLNQMNFSTLTFIAGTANTKSGVLADTNTDTFLYIKYDGSTKFTAWISPSTNSTSLLSIHIYYKIANVVPSYKIGGSLTASGGYSYAEGYNTTASGNYSHAEGYYTTASDYYSHAEGNHTTASKSSSHAEGQYTEATGYYSHAEGNNTKASNYNSHAEGYYTTASGQCCHAEGFYSEANGYYSHAQNYYTIANADSQTVIGKYNDCQADTAFEIGNGTGSARSNAFTVDWRGRVKCGDNSGAFKYIFDIFYPVGSYYETSLPYATPSGQSQPTATDLANLGVTWFDPNYAWGGTWSLEAAGKFHISAGTGYTAGSTGGSAYIQAHTHGFTNPTYKITQTAANVQHAGEYVSVDQAMSWNRGTITSNSTATYKYLRSTADPSAAVHRTTPTIPEKAITQVNGGAVGAVSGATTGSAGNLPPYVAVNRWHRTA